MSKRVLVSSLVGVVAVGAVGAVAAGGIAVASASSSAGTKVTVANSSVRYVAPSGAAAGSITFTADVSDDSGVRGLKVLAWPASSKLDPTEAELRDVADARCHGTTASRCTYTLAVTKAEAAELAPGTWHVSVLATAKDGDTTFVPRAAAFDVTR
ncbi:DUF5707 domain-containing protein [Streptomyces sp. yr375]|uniref:DUF5707 domain-containing protein n=1 Tax=Streptomyces sp. yr375 TaxID=1761906 RepID=UPI000B850495|nr:DUF5707 domain-containing protein [Streptomyces sp. yr375]